jgi:hypothetical protein
MTRREVDGTSALWLVQLEQSERVTAGVQIRGLGTAA